MSNRFKALDGLRACAALGVLWIHCWSWYGAPRFVLKGVDVASIVALGGNGVDLFFVISGFCMYYFYAENKLFNGADFWKFLKKRWIRLSPAFYTACLVYIVIAAAGNQHYPVFETALSSAFYLNGIWQTPNAILWSLTAEWEFYVIVPFLLIYQNRLGFTLMFTLISSILILAAVASIMVMRSRSDMLTGQIVFRYVQFMWGILTGRLLLMQPQFQTRFRGIIFFIFVIIAYTGRILISKPILSLSADYYNLFKLAGFLIMALGFAGIIYLVITSKRYLKLIFGNKIISFIGKISFSFYLWHALVHPVVSGHMANLLGHNRGIMVPFISFLISTAVLIPLSALSYNFLEKPFMARNKH